MSADVEAVARAICGCHALAHQATGLDDKGHIPWEQFVDISWPLYAGHARAAIAAYQANAVSGSSIPYEQGPEISEAGIRAMYERGF